MSAFQISPLSTKLYKQRVENCFNEVQEQLDSSYNKISQSIDQIILDSNQLSVDNLQCQSTNPLSFIQSLSTFTKEQINPILSEQIISKIQPSIYNILQKELQNKEQELNQQFQLKLNKEIQEMKKEQTKFEEIIKKKDLEIQEIIQNSNNEEKQKKQIKEGQNLNSFTFDLMIENSIKQYECCSSIAFNKDDSIVIAGCSKDIKVFQHIQGKLNQIQLLSEHRNNVTTLNFMKNKNGFVSGSCDSSIILWQVIGNNQWMCQQKLNGHSNQIYCLLMNNTDDLIISGSDDCTIKFWMKQDQWLCQQTIANQRVFTLSLNEQQNKLISCSNDYQILVIEWQKLDKKWSVTQIIEVDQFGLRLCFINENQFTFQPYCQEQMHVYEMDSNKKQYMKTKEIVVKYCSNDDSCLFPQQYLKSKCLLVNKNGCYVNIMRKKQNGDFIIQQSIQFDTVEIYGQLSDDGKYLITWDSSQMEIQIRKLREL